MEYWLPEQATHTVEASAPTAVENVPAPHGVQLEAPVESAYVPAGHITHVDFDVAPLALE